MNIFIKSLIFNLFVFITSIIFINITIKFAFEKEGFYIKNKYICEKYDSYKRGNFNTLFLGTSLTETGLNPDIFDSLNKSSNTFNLGIFGISTIEYLKFTQFVIQNSNEKLNHIVFELRSPYHIRGIQFSERRENIELKDLGTIINLCANQVEIPMHRRFLIFTTHFNAFLLNLNNVGIFQKSQYHEKNLKMYTLKGFFNPNKKTKKFIKFEKSLNYETTNYPIDLLYVKEINNIIYQAKLKKIKITFWIPPNLPNWENSDIASFRKFLKNVVIIDGNKNQSLLNKDIWYDKPHLNSFGADLNTHFLYNSLKYIL